MLEVKRQSINGVMNALVISIFAALANSLVEYFNLISNFAKNSKQQYHIYLTLCPEFWQYSVPRLTLICKLETWKDGHAAFLPDAGRDRLLTHHDGRREAFNTDATHRSRFDFILLDLRCYASRQG